MFRLKLLDLYKLALAFFLVTFHVSNSFYPTVESTDFDYSWFYPVVERASWHYFYFTGLLVVGVSFFLMGFNQQKRRWFHYVILLVGHLFVQSSTGEWEGSIEATFDWGVFSFLTIALLVVDISLRLPRAIGWGLRLLPLLLLLQPQAFYQSWIKELNGPWWLQPLLIGAPLGEGVYSGWFLLPWICWPLLFFSIGQMMRHYQLWLQKFYLPLDISMGLFFIWSLVTIINLDLTYYVGSFYTQTLFSLETYQILALMGLLLPVLRLSLLAPIIRWTESRWGDFSQWGWARHFWLAYLIHFGFIAMIEALSGNYPIMMQYPYADLLGVFVFLYSSYVANLFYVFYQPYFKRWFYI